MLCSKPKSSSNAPCSKDELIDVPGEGKSTLADPSSGEYTFCCVQLEGKGEGVTDTIAAASSSDSSIEVEFALIFSHLIL